MPFFAKEFSDNFDSYFIGPEHILYVVLDMGGDFIEFLQLNGLDVFKLKDIIETHVLESSIPQQPGDQVIRKLFSKKYCLIYFIMPNTTPFCSYK